MNKTQRDELRKTIGPVAEFGTLNLPAAEALKLLDGYDKAERALQDVVNLVLAPFGKRLRTIDIDELGPELGKNPIQGEAVVIGETADEPYAGTKIIVESAMTQHLAFVQKLQQLLSPFILWGKELATQDNAITADPLFIVEDEERVYGVSPDYRDGTETYTEGTGKKTRVGYSKRWKFVTACLTRAEAEEVLRRERHNLKNPRVFTASAHMNPGWKALRSALLKLADLA